MKWLLIVYFAGGMIMVDEDSYNTMGECRVGLTKIVKMNSYNIEKVYCIEGALNENRN